MLFLQEFQAFVIGTHLLLSTLPLLVTIHLLHHFPRHVQSFLLFYVLDEHVKTLIHGVHLLTDDAVLVRNVLQLIVSLWVRGLLPSLQNS